MRELPGPDFWALIHPHTGGLADLQPTDRGFSSDVTAVVAGEQGRFFVKAMRNRAGGRRDSLLRERVINPHVQPIAPALRWHVENNEWIILGFDLVEGVHADFTPGSANLPAVVEALAQIGALGLPEAAREWHETRWDRFAGDGAELIAGDALLYTDINPSNFLTSPQGTWVVDWAWPTRGAAFIDPACLVLQLVAAGHTPEAAERWAAQCEAWTSADPKAVDAFVAADVRMHRTFAVRRPGASWIASMAQAAEAWAAHRGVVVADRPLAVTT